jgi:maleate isomerase
MVAERADFESAFQTIVEDLRADVAGSRTTLRIDISVWGVDVDTPIAEATSAEAASIRGATLDQRSLLTVQHLNHERKMLVHNDCTTADPPPPKALLDVYGVKAQMLAPLVRDDHLAGWLSVHYTLSPRVWSAADVEALEHAVAKVHEVLTEIESAGTRIG